MDDGKLAYLRTATKMRPTEDIVFTDKGVPTGHVIAAKRESSDHVIYPKGFIDGYAIVIFDEPKEKHWVSWAGTIITTDSVTAEVEKFDYFIDGQWISFSEAMAKP